MTRLDHQQSDRPGFQPSVRPSALRLYLFDPAAGAMASDAVVGFSIDYFSIQSSAEVRAEDLKGAGAVVIQLRPDDPQAVATFTRLRESSDVPLLVAAYDPPLAFVRQLVRAGAHDVIPLPLEREDLEASLAPVRNAIDAASDSPKLGASRFVCTIRSEGGIGATALTTQLATRHAATEAEAGRTACLIDFDLQFGDAAFQLGMTPSLTLADLIAAGSRVDRDLLSTIAKPHSSGLHVLAAPKDIVPLDLLTPDRAIALLELAMDQYDTVFVDLPANWTDWSLSLLARADLVLLVTGLSVPSLSRARRQLDLIEQQSLGTLDIRIIVNRFESGLFRNVDRSDLQRVLGREADFTVVREDEVMNETIELGVPMNEVRRRSRLSKDLDALGQGVAAALGER
ncbi:cellulose synthase operon protein YhjQ/BcsQ [Sphingomicrobium sp. XHP0239]|uniref:AAA family ATPase n=1 Tax=Sphingomicrobium maritimum TaxID=3133972 RepID=UPI0031CC5855